MRIYFNSKVGSEMECIEKKLRDCMYKLTKCKDPGKIKKMEQKVHKLKTLLEKFN